MSDPHPLWRPVREVLWRDWNPIAPDMPEDEYDSYVLPVIGKLIHGASVENIASYLNQVREETIGMGPDRKSDLEIAAQLVALRDKEK